MADSLDKLPYLCLKAIFNHLDAKSILACRSVCKSFKLLSDQTVIDELIVSDELERARDLWFHTGDLIDCSTAISTRSFVPFVSSPTFKLEQNLKRLQLNIKRARVFDLSILNKLQGLEQLYLLFDHPPASGHAKLTLTNLRICEFSSPILVDLDLDLPILHAPNLAYLKSTCRDGLDIVPVEDPKTVKHLEVDSYSRAVRAFENLETLQINHLLQDNSHVFDREIVTAFKNLKVLNVNFRHSRESIYEVAKEDLIHIKKQMAESARSVAINVNGVPFDEDLFLSGCARFGFHESQYSFDSALVVQMKNYDRLTADRLSFVTQMDYNALHDLMPGPFPDDFFKKFHNIRLVKTAREVAKPEEFIRFLSNLKCIEELNLNDSCLKQFSLDQLPQACSQLVRFQFFDHKRFPINFNFALKFPLLARFATNKKFSIYWAVKALKSLANLKSIEFKFRNSEISLLSSKNEYTYTCSFKLYDEGNDTRSFTKDQSGLDAMIAFSKSTLDSAKINKIRSQLGGFSFNC